MNDAVIELENVSRCYVVGDTVVRALDDVSLAIEDRSFTAIMGPSGSGKSTLMSLIGCLDVPTSGVIRIDGEVLEGMSEEDLAYIRNRKMPFLFGQDRKCDFSDGGGFIRSRPLLLSITTGISLVRLSCLLNKLRELNTLDRLSNIITTVINISAHSVFLAKRFELI